MCQHFAAGPHCVLVTFRLRAVKSLYTVWMYSPCLSSDTFKAKPFTKIQVVWTHGNNIDMYRLRLARIASVDDSIPPHHRCMSVLDTAYLGTRYPQMCTIDRLLSPPSPTYTTTTKIPTVSCVQKVDRVGVM